MALGITHSSAVPHDGISSGNITRNPTNIDDHPLSRWTNSSAEDGVHERLVAASSPGEVAFPRFSFDPSTIRPPSSTYSMAVSARTPTVAPSVTSTEPPNLSHGGSTTGSSDFSASTDQASNPSGIVQLPDIDDPALAAESDGRAARSSRLHCAFYFLDCGFTSEDEDEWKTHCLSHFRGHAPPLSASCPLCDWAHRAQTGYEAWDHRMRHLALHLAVGERLTDGRADFQLIRYLWQKRIISDAQLKELKCNFNGNRPREPYTVTQGNLREQRREPMR